MCDLQPIEQDKLVLQIRNLLPAPVRGKESPFGSLILIGGKPSEVVVKIRASKVSVAVYMREWEGVCNLKVRPKKLAIFDWKRLPASWTIASLGSLINCAAQLRRESYRKCQRCGETIAPEWMHDEDNCQDCATRYLGVVY